MLDLLELLCVRVQSFKVRRACTACPMAAADACTLKHHALTSLENRPCLVFTVFIHCCAPPTCHCRLLHSIRNVRGDLLPRNEGGTLVKLLDAARVGLKVKRVFLGSFGSEGLIS